MDELIEKRVNSVLEIIKKQSDYDDAYEIITELSCNISYLESSDGKVRPNVSCSIKKERVQA